MNQILLYTLFFTLNLYNFQLIGKFFFNSFGFNNKDLYNFVSKINSIIHAIYIVIVSKHFIHDNIDKNTFLESLDVTKAYLIYDTLTMVLYYKYVSSLPLMVCHHLAFLLSLFSKSVENYPKFVALGLIAEITNLSLYFGWFLMKKRLGDSILFIINGVLLITTFFYYRVFNFTSLFLIVLSLPDKKNETLFIFIIMLLNIYWFTRLIEQFIKSLLLFIHT